MIVLILNGPAAGGKGTVCKLLRSTFDLNVIEYSSIDYVKKTAKDKFGWDGKKDAKGRVLLSKVKQLMIEYNDLPFKKVVQVIEYTKKFSMLHSIKFNIDVLAVDVREPEEISKIVEYCDTNNIIRRTCLVNNTKAERKAIDCALDKLGDLSFNKYVYDIILQNDLTISHLEKKVRSAFSLMFS